MITSKGTIISTTLLWTFAAGFNIHFTSRTSIQCSKRSFSRRSSFQLYTSPVDDDLNSWTVAQLKDKLKKFDLKVSGKKDELIQRLKDYNSEQNKLEDDQECVSQTEIISPKSSKNNIQILKHDEVEVSSFEELNLISSLQSSIKLQGWEEPTPIQKLAIPTILKHFGDDNDYDFSCTSIWAEAPTGSGKVSIAPKIE